MLPPPTPTCAAGIRYACTYLYLHLHMCPKTQLPTYLPACPALPYSLSAGQPSSPLTNCFATPRHASPALSQNGRNAETAYLPMARSPDPAAAGQDALTVAPSAKMAERWPRAQILPRPVRMPSLYCHLATHAPTKLPACQILPCPVRMHSLIVLALLLCLGQLFLQLLALLEQFCFCGRLRL